MADLNPKQQIAANHIEGPLLVLAGAGSGKTRVATFRVSHLLNIGIPSSDIVALTFTNKAAEEMRHRIKQLSNQHVLTCTFHSLGARILRESIEHLGYTGTFTIYDQNDSENLIKNCVASLGLKEDKAVLKSLKSHISQAKNDLIGPENLSIDPHSPESRLLKQVYSLYQTRLKGYNALDFDDLLFLTVKLLESSKEILEKYQHRWRFVLIDEYQDTNFAQYRLTKLLVAKHHNLFVVGDPDQSIYSWRGANIANILSFEKDFPGAQVITLEQNYRSTSYILNGANAVIAHNKKRYEKKLWSDLGTGNKIGLFIAGNEHEEAGFVVERLLKHVQNDKYPLSDCVIFYRTNAQSRIFEDLLLQKKIPYLIIGGLSFYQRREIKDILALLRMAISPADFLSFTRTINLPKRGIGQKTLEKFQDLSIQFAQPILSICHQLVTSPASLDDSISKKQQTALADYLTIISILKGMHERHAPLADIVKTAIERSHYLSYLKEDPDSYHDRKENLDELITKASEWHIDHASSNLTDFLEELSLRSTLDESTPQDAVRLMTLHNGKGLEYPLVFIVGLEEDLLPHLNAKTSSDSIEEERRLFYVGMTRAKKNLYLTASQFRTLWGTPRLMNLSRFFKEVPSEYTLSFNPKTPSIEDFPESLELGTSVYHKDFGKGMIQKIYNTSLGLTYDVLFFNTHTVRSMVAKYARFTREV